MARYLLPCTCGQKLEVEAKQAGLQVKCRCGKSLEVPTLRNLKQLTPVASTPSEAAAAASASAAWGPRQGITFLGVVVMLCGLGGATVLFATRPVYDSPDIDPDEFRKRAMQLTLEESFQAWETLQKQGFSKNLSPQVRTFEERSAAYTRWLVASGILAGLGAAMAGAALASGSSALAPGKRPTRKA